MVGSCIAALGRTLAAELRTPPAPLAAAETREEAELAPSAIPLEAAEATEPTEPVTPEAEEVAEAMLVMATELDREERAPPSRDEDADGALMVVERDPEADWPAQSCCWSWTADCCSSVVQVLMISLKPV
jgi:hypothetical protein